MPAPLWGFLICFLVSSSKKKKKNKNLSLHYCETCMRNDALIIKGAYPPQEGSGWVNNDNKATSKIKVGKYVEQTVLFLRALSDAKI
jgi:hypothetical protein